MKLALATLMLVAACQSPAAEAPRPAAEAPRTVVAFKSDGDLDLGVGPMNVVEFLKTCQESAGVNFTYTKATSTALIATELRFDSATRVSKDGVPDFIVATLDAHRFAIEPVGPEHLRVLLVESKRS